MIKDQTTAIVAIVRGIAQELREGLLPTLAEGHIKVVSVQALLREGFTLREGAHEGAKDKLLALRQGVLQVERVNRIKARPAEGLAGRWHTCDVRIESPITLAVLLKAGSLYGTLDVLEHKKIRKDLNHIKAGRADVLIIAADRKLYDYLRGKKDEKRGRPAHSPDQFAEIFPESTRIPTETIGREDISIGTGGGWLAVRTRSVASPEERLVIAWWPPRLDLGRTPSHKLSQQTSPRDAGVHGMTLDPV